MFKFFGILPLVLVIQVASGQSQPKSPLSDSYLEHQQLKNNTTYNLEWVSLGPVMNGSRVEAVQADPNNPGTIYAAFGSGGLWKTVDNGLNWRPVFENMPSLGIGDIALAPSNTNVIYLGTGESLKKARNFTMPGNGIYRSDDAGESWSHLGLEDTWHVGEIVVHPTNSEVVLVAALGHFWSENENRGIFRSEDGGKTWSHVFKIDSKTGANDIVFSPSNPDVLYASFWENHPTTHGSNSGIYKSEDGGSTWKKSQKGIKIDDNTGRIGISASYQNPLKAYAFVDQRNGNPARKGGEFYQTTDGGENWVKTHNPPIESLSVIGWYFMDTYVDPMNDDEVYLLGVKMLYSSDGGKNFQYLDGDVTHINTSPAQTLHLDHCELWVNPKNPSNLILGNDGGLYQSYDKGNSWLHYNNIPTGEFYDIEIDKSSPYKIYGGTQDDATAVGTGEFEFNPKLTDTWEYLWIDAWSGGDGCITLVDPIDPNTIYFSMQNGGARRMDLTTKTSKSIRPRFPKEDSIDINFSFITPYMVSSYNSDRLYMAGNYITRSDNRGETWALISPDLTKSKEVAAGAFAESPFDEGTLYVGTDRGTMWITQNNGEKWKDISGEFPENYVRSIVPSQHKDGRIYIQLTGLNYDDLGAYLFTSEDFGQNWKSIKSNLPNHPINVIHENPIYQNLLFAGTFRGIYVSVDRGNTWEYLGSEMPDCSIADIEFHEKSGDLIVATHGRGIYKMNINPILERMESSQNEVTVFKVPKMTVPKRRDTHGDYEKRSIKRYPITFWIERAQEVELKIKSSDGLIQFEQSITGLSGFNQWRWDLSFESVAGTSPYQIHDKKYLYPGKYEVEVWVGEEVYSQKFQIDK